MGAGEERRTPGFPRQEDALVPQEGRQPPIAVAVGGRQALVITHGLVRQIQGKGRPDPVDDHGPRKSLRQRAKPVDKLGGPFLLMFVNRVVFENREDRLRRGQRNRVRRGQRIEILESRLLVSKSDRTDRKTSTEGGAVDRHVRGYTSTRGGTPPMHPESGDAFVEDQKNTVVSAGRKNLLQRTLRRWDDAKTAHQGIDDQRSDLGATTGHCGDDLCHIPSGELADAVGSVDCEIGRRANTQRGAPVED